MCPKCTDPVVLSRVPTSATTLTPSGKLQLKSGVRLLPNPANNWSCNLVHTMSDAAGNMIESNPESNNLPAGIETCTKCPDQHKLANAMSNTM